MTMPDSGDLHSRPRTHDRLWPALAQPGGVVFGQRSVLSAYAITGSVTRRRLSKGRFHVDPHREGDFWHEEVSPGSPRGDLRAEARIVALEVDGVKITERPLDILTGRRGLSRSCTPFLIPRKQTPVKMALKEIQVDHSYPTVVVASGPEPGVVPFPTEVLFRRQTERPFVPIGVAGGDFQKFAGFADGALLVDVPEGNNWGKTGLFRSAVVRSMTAPADPHTADPDRRSSPDNVNSSWRSARTRSPTCGADHQLGSPCPAEERAGPSDLGPIQLVRGMDEESAGRLDGRVLGRAAPSISRRRAC